MKRCLVLIFIVAALAAQDARQLFEKQCSVCHGDGHGTERGPNLADNRRVRSASMDELRAVIRDGVPARGMPAFALPAVEIEALTQFVRSFSAPAAESHPAGDSAAGERYFFGAGACSNCHMALGKGKAIGPDLSVVGREMTFVELEEAVRKPTASVKASVRFLDSD